MPPKRLSPQPTSRIGKSDRTRTALLNSAFDFVWTRPYRYMTVSSVTGPVGVSRFAINRLDAYTLLQAFGQHPRMLPEPVREALIRIWISTLYGAQWTGKQSSDLVRT